MKCLSSGIAQHLFHRDGAYFIGAQPISSGHSLFHRGTAYFTGVCGRLRESHARHASKARPPAKQARRTGEAGGCVRLRLKKNRPCQLKPENDSSRLQEDGSGRKTTCHVKGVRQIDCGLWISDCGILINHRRTRTNTNSESPSPVTGWRKKVKRSKDKGERAKD